MSKLANLFTTMYNIEGYFVLNESKAKGLLGFGILGTSVVLLIYEGVFRFYCVIGLCEILL